MSTRLDLALQELADAAGATSGFGDPDTSTTVQTVARLTARVRRRRTVRGAGTAAVAASAVGAVAFVGPRLTVDVAPAADPDAAPGTCRSSVTTLPSGQDDALDVWLGPLTYDYTGEVRAATADLGTWQSGTADLQVTVFQVPEGTTGPTRLRLLLAQDDVVLGSGQAPLTTTPTTADAVIRSMTGTEPWGATEDRPVYGLESADDLWWTTTQAREGVTGVAQDMALDLTACDGSGPLDAGTYDVWATTVDSQGDARGSSGPWEVTVALQEPRVDDLPEDFPDHVRIIDGRLVTAHRHGAGWAAEVVTHGDDRAKVAAHLLEQVALPPSDETSLLAETRNVPLGGSATHVRGWVVWTIPSQTPDGEPSVVYVLIPS